MSKFGRHEVPGMNIRDEQTVIDRDFDVEATKARGWWAVIAAMLLAVVLLWCVSPVHAAVAAEWRVNLLKGTTTIDTPTGATEADAWAKCQALIPKAAASSTTYRCQTPVFSAVVTADPVTCPPAPASTTRTQQCPAGTTGSWTQTSTSTVGPAPNCTVTTTWAPAIAPAGACVTPPPPTGTATALVCTSGCASEQAYSATQPQSYVADPTGKLVLWCRAGLIKIGGAIADCGTPQWYSFGGMQGYSILYTSAGWHTLDEWKAGVSGAPPTQPPPVQPPPATGSATLGWTPPTQNADGSALTNLAGFRLLYGQSATALTQTAQIANPSASTYVVNGLAAGTWYFSVRAYTSSGAESDDSNIATKVLP